MSSRMIAEAKPCCVVVSHHEHNTRRGSGLCTDILILLVEMRQLTHDTVTFTVQSPREVQSER